MPERIKDRDRSEKAFTGFLLIATTVSLVAIFAILAFLLYFARPLFTFQGLREVFTWHWRPFQGDFGILPMITGSIVLSVLAIIIAFPVGYLICAFNYKIGPGSIARLTMAVVHFMTSIPTIVYAFIGAMVLPKLIREYVQTGSGFSLLAALVMLVILVLPTVILLLNAAWSGYKESIGITCASLGITIEQEIFGVMPSIAGRGLVIVLITGFARALGDTMIALMLAGNAPQVPGSLFDSFRVLTAHIALVIAVDSTTSAYHSVFASGLILLLITGLVSISVRYIESVARQGRM